MSDGKPVTERVTMLWPADLKKEVAELVGSRGTTKFTLAAVREALLRATVEPTAEPAESEPVDPWTAPLAGNIEVRDPAVAKEPEPTLKENLIAKGKATLKPAVEVAKPREGSLEETIARARDMIGKRTGTDDLPIEAHIFRGGTTSGRCGVWGCGQIEADAAHLRTGLVSEMESEEPGVVPVEQDPDKCPDCQEPLVDGECWSCG